MPDNSHTFAGRLRNLREQRRLSKTALGKMLGVSTTCVWNWERGNTEPRIENLLSLSKVLDVEADYLEFGGLGSGNGESSSEHAPSVLTGSTEGQPPALQEVIGAAKIQIAKLAGINPSKVNISLEY